MTLVREFDLYLNAGKAIPLLINVNQYDHDEQWLFTLYDDNGIKYVPSTGAIVGIKSDGLGIINSGSVDSEGRVVINETQQMTAAEGKATFELTIDSGSHGTANFNVLVEKKPGDNADLSESDLSLIQEATEAAGRIEESIQYIYRKKYNALEHGIKGDGVTDDTDAIQALFDSADWFTEIYFPSGTYLISSPLTLGKRISIYGDYQSFTTAERIHTVFKDNGLEANETMLTVDYFTLVRDICFDSDSYEFDEDREAFLADRHVNPFTETINVANVGAIACNNYGNFEHLYIHGFSGVGIAMGNYGLAQDISFRESRIAMSLGTDNIINNIRHNYGYNVVSSMGGENMITNVRADSIKGIGIRIVGGENQLRNMIFDWCYTNALNILGNGNLIDMSLGRCGIYAYSLNPATSPDSFSGDSGRDNCCVRLTAEGTYKPKGNHIKIVGYKGDLSDNNSGIWLMSPMVAFTTSGGVIEGNVLELTNSDVDLYGASFTNAEYRRFLNVYYTSYNFTGQMIINGVPVRFESLIKTNYDTAIKKVTFA